MKKLYILLIIAALLLAGCAKTVETVPVSATLDEATADQATLDEATPDEPTEKPTEPPTLDELAQQRYDKILAGKVKGKAKLKNVEAIHQYPDMEAACESMALTSAINHFGYDLDKYTIVDKYLEYADDCVTGYCGDPHTFYEGAGIYPPGLVTSTWNFIKDKKADLYPFDTSGLSLNDLYKFLDNGCPVLIWTSVDRQWPSFEGGTEYKGTYYPWFPTEHCVCLYGYDKSDGQVLVADSWYGTDEWEDAGLFEDIYNEIGKFSMILMDTSKLK